MALSIIADSASRLRKAFAKQHQNARQFIAKLCSMFGRNATSLTSPASFGPDYRRGHTSLESSDAPYGSLSAIASMEGAPDTVALCGSTGIINFGMFGLRPVIKMKWLVRCVCPRERVVFM